MILKLEEEKMLIKKLRDILSDVEFGRICCRLVISDQHLMYIDFMREKNERLFFHSKPENKGGEENE